MSLFAFVVCIALFCTRFGAGTIDNVSLILIFCLELSDYVLCLLVFELQYLASPFGFAVCLAMVRTRIGTIIIACVSFNLFLRFVLFAYVIFLLIFELYNCANFAFLCLV